MGGDGDDVIDVTNDPSTSRGPDNVDRGRGRDIVYADAEDTVTNCERVVTGPMPANPDIADVYARAEDAFGVTWPR